MTVKVRDVINLIEADGWYLVVTRAAIASTSIRPSQVVSLSPVIQEMIWLQVR
jgi:hypothetical protein